MTACQKVGRLVIRVLVWILVLAVWVGAFALVYYTVGVWTPTVWSLQGYLCDLLSEWDSCTFFLFKRVLFFHIYLKEDVKHF